MKRSKKNMLFVCMGGINWYIVSDDRIKKTVLSKELKSKQCKLKQTNKQSKGEKEIGKK